MPPLSSPLLATSLRASIFILLLLVTRSLLRRWLGSRAVAALWLLTAASLLLPASVRVPWNVPSLLPAPARAALARPFTFRVSVSPAAPTVRPGQSLPISRAPSPTPASGGNLWTLLWLTGTLFVTANLARNWCMTRRWAARTSPAAADPRLAQVFLALPAPWRRRVALRLTDDLDVPTLAGILRPQIWFPRALLDTLQPSEIHHVLLHELGHARRRDLLAQWLCSLVCAVHWFNPLVWLLARLARTDRELACDAWVLTRVSRLADDAPGFPSAYGHTLLKVVERLRAPSLHGGPALVSMAAGRRCLGLRIREIGAFRALPPWRGAFVLGVALTVLAAFTVRGGVAALPVAPVPAQAPPLPAAPAPPSGAASPAPGAVAPAPASSSATPQIEIESKFIELSEPSVLALRDAVGTTPSAAELNRQIVAFFQARSKPGVSRPGFARYTLVDDAGLQSFVRVLNETKGVDLLSAPRVTTKSGQQATIEIVREMYYPVAFDRKKDADGKPIVTPAKFDKTNTGVVLEVTPSFAPAGDTIDLSFAWKLTAFEGFARDDGQPAGDVHPGDGTTHPEFSTHSMSTVASLPPGGTVVLSADADEYVVRAAKGAPEPADGQAVAASRVGFVDDLLRLPPDSANRQKTDASAPNEKRLLLVLITARLVNPAEILPAKTHPAGSPSRDPAAPGSEGMVSPSPASEVAPGVYRAASKYSYGVPVPGKPGFVTSPYAPDSGYVDLTGYKRDQEVRDPYTNKIFLVP